ncbi:excisionase family DNA-binding protein [Corynebacterium liangguodongii]|uniref:DNA-binding protein n=1 Tax=Corynebacterium liangguodongii TaxID=2079535 RepID=A0A2S0WGB8_9CORY|nr:excisionase family DNA-binding protein [Corynebacterium liangguodongii]AWB84821.1 DNA-binding protein [Corynebacterium liangguodongii]PWB99178.1 helix-turn-helix domain-containing protein [Corynebacterium liangguodongii]
MGNLDYITTSEFARRISSSEKYVTNNIKAGRIAAVKLGRAWRIREDQVDAFMETIALENELQATA